MKIKRAAQPHDTQHSLRTIPGGKNLHRSGLPTKPVWTIVLFLATLSFPALSSAQQKPAKLELFGGYSYVRIDSTTFGFADYSNLNGFDVEATYNFAKGFGVVGDISGNYGNHLSFYNFLIGPQISFRRGNRNIFGRVLFGKADNRVNLAGGLDSSGRALGVGVGFDYQYSPRIAIRVIQIDYLNTHTFDTTQGNLRASVGLVFQWGKK